MSKRHPPTHTAANIRTHLRAILDHYDAAADPPKTSDDSAPTRGGDPARPPTDVHAIDCRIAAQRRVTYWVQFILDEVNDGTITHKPGNDLRDLAAFVDTWALALAEQHPDSASGHKEACLEELARAARDLKAVAHGTRTRKIEVGPCPEVVIAIVDDAEVIRRCDGTIFAALTERDPDNDDDGLLPKHLTCTADRTHSWQPWQWADIGKRIERMTA